MGQTPTVPQLDPSEIEFEDDPQPSVKASAQAAPSATSNIPQLSPSDIEFEGDQTTAPTAAQPNPLAATLQTAKSNIAQYPENQAKPDPAYLQRKNAFEAVQGEPGAPENFEEDPEQERLIRAQQEVQSQHSPVPQAAVPALQTANKYAVQPFERMSAKGAEVGRDLAGRALVSPPSEDPASDFYLGAPTTPITQQEVEERLKGVPAPIVGAARAVGSVAGGLAADPRMWPFFFAGPETAPLLNQAAGTGFSTQMAVGAYEQAGELGKIMDNPDVPSQDKWEAGANAVLSALMAGHAEGSKIAGQFAHLPAEDQAGIRAKMQQKAPEMAKAVEQASNPAGANQGNIPNLQPDQVEMEGQKPAGAKVKPGTSAAIKLEDGQKFNTKLYKSVQLENGDSYVYNPKKTSADVIKQADADGTLWKLVGGEAPREAKVQVEQDLKGEAPQPQKHEFASTQVNVDPQSELGQRHAQAVAAIPNDHLGPNGKEDTPHVTVRYGLKDDSPEAIAKIKEAASKIAPFEATVGKTGSFPATKEGDRPIIAHVEQNPELNALRSVVEGAGNFKEDTHGDYKPHVSLGYVKPEHVGEYEGGNHLEGGKVPVDHIVVSKRDGTSERIELGDKNSTAKDEVTPQLSPEQVEHEERRTAEGNELRDRFGAMTPEEQTKALVEYHQRERTSGLTGLPNKVAFDEDEKTMGESHPHVGYFDLDDFKDYNTKMGHEGADTVLQAAGKIFHDATLKEPSGSVKVYHRSGDEFNARVKDPEAIKRITQRVNEELGNSTFRYETPDGTIQETKGPGVSHGIGTDHKSAELDSKADKQRRKAAGLRTGERDKQELAEPGAEGRETPVSNDAGRNNIPAESAKSPESGVREIPRTAEGYTHEATIDGKVVGRATSSERAESILNVKQKQASKKEAKFKITKADIVPTEGGSYEARPQESTINAEATNERQSTEGTQEAPAGDQTQGAERSQRKGAASLIQAVYGKLKTGESLGNVTELNKMAEEHFGSGRDSGDWTPKDAFDAMEAGVNKYLLERGKELMDSNAVDGLKEIRRVMARIPSQGVRTEEQIKNQQFSTPPTEAYLVAKVAGIKPSDVVLEPSAGNGGLAIWAKAVGAETHVNEISDRRQEMLKAVGFDKPTSHDGELINALLDPKVKPTVIVMNPPFSASAIKSHAAKNDNKYGFNHIDQALQRLQPGGRLVAILGGGRADDTNGGASLNTGPSGKWFDRIADRYNVRANIRINGKEYQKYGTNFATRMIVIDKDGPTPFRGKGIRTWDGVKQANVDTLEEAYHELRNVAESRPEPAGTSDTNRAGEGEPGTGVGADKNAGGTSDREPGAGKPEAGETEQPSNRPAGSDGESGGNQPSESAEPVSLREPEGGSKEPGKDAEAAGRTEGGNQDGDTERPVSSLNLERATERRAEREDTSAYAEYQPSLKGPDHPGSIVETKTMSTVPLPPITYKPSLSESVIKDGKLSAVQLEAVALSGQQNDIRLPSGHRSTLLIGDGTGVGKGREGAAIMMDHWSKGRRRIAFVSEKWDLMDAASRDLKSLGAHDLDKKMIPFGKIKATTPIDHEGILYTTYALIRSEDKKGNTRAEQLKQWLRGGDDAEKAAIIWDESHNLKNAVTEQGQQASQIGVAAKKLMDELPNLRSTSLSATAATDVMNMGYMDRLGLWGPGTAFPNGFMEFANQIGRGGMSAMEMIARELKSQGKYLARTLSYKGVTYSELEHKITPEQKELYRTATKAWQMVVEKAEDTIKNTTGGGARARGRFLSQFYSSQQRFFNVLLTTMKIPTAVEKAHQALADGKSVVISLVNTNEAAQNREKNKYRGEDHDSDEVPDYDFGPGEMLQQLVREHYPVQQYADDVDAAGNKIKVPVTQEDADGRVMPVLNPEAVAARDQLMKDLKQSLHMPANPLDILIEQLGGRDKVAEMTGRKETYDQGLGKFISRGGKDVKRDEINLSEMRNFQDGKKRIAIISSAAATGISLHADNTAKNQQQRVHITLQPGWSADKTMQSLGRTHRTNQVHPPEYVFIKSDLGGEARFVSTIARRLGSLEALSKGQSKTNEGTDMMSKVNFETDQGRQATSAFYTKLLANAPIPGTEGGGTEPMRGMSILEDLRVLKNTENGKTVPDADRTNVTRLLNRLLALDPDKQNAVYNYFYDIFDATVKQAVENGTLDTGVKTLPGDNFNVREERPIAADPNTGAQTFYYPIESKIKTNRVSPDDMESYMERRGALNPRVLRNKDGKLVLVIDANPIVHASGQTEPAVQAISPENGNWKKQPFYSFNQWKEYKSWAEEGQKQAKTELDNAVWQRDYQKERLARNPTDEYTRQALARREEEVAQKQERFSQMMDTAQDPKAGLRNMWQQRYDAAPTHDTEEHHLIGGAVMRYWNPIHEASPVLNIYTTVDSNSGKRVVGIDIPKGKIDGLLSRISGGKSTVNAQQIRTDVLENGTPYQLEGGIQVKLGRVAGKKVVQFVPPNEQVAANLRNLGVVYEKGVMPIHYLANNVERDRVLNKILEQYPAKVASEGGQPAEEGQPNGPLRNRRGERGSSTMSAMPIPALVEAVATGVKKGGELYHGAVDKLLEAVHMGQPRSDIRKFDPDAADLALKMDAGGQYHKAVGEMISKNVTGPLTEEFSKTDTPEDRAKKNEISRDRMKGFHFMADEDNRHWLLENHPDDYHRWNSDPKITKALMEYAPYENDLRSAVKQLGGKTIDDDYIKRVMDFTTSGVAYEPDTMRKLGIEGPEQIQQGGNKAGFAAGKDSTVSPQVDRSKARKDSGQFYWDHGVFDFGPSFQKRWTEVMSKLDEHRLAVHSMSMGTRIDGKEGMPEKIFYNGHDFYRSDIAKEIRDVNRRGVSSESKDLADALGVDELPAPKDVKTYGVYEPMKGSRFENASRNLASRVLNEGAGADGIEAQAANVNRMAKLRYAIPEEISQALHDAGREKETGALTKLATKILGPVMQAIRQQVVGLAYGVPHMANVLRKVMQATSGSVLNPMAWANAFHVAFDKELKQRGINGVADPRYDMLLRNGAISEGAIPEYKHYIEGNLDPRNWDSFKETIGNAFRQEGKAGKDVTPISALAGVGRLAFEPLNRFSEAGHDNLFKAGGIDQRARIWLADYTKNKFPKMSDTAIVHEVNMTLGRYNRASWTDLQRAIAPLMFFPGWDYSSMAYALKHPFKTTVAPAVLMLMANSLISAIGANHRKDEHDLASTHVGNYSIKTNLINDNMGDHIWGWALRGGQAALDRRGTKDATNRMVHGLPSDLAGVSTGTLNPILSGAASASFGKQRPGGGGDIVPQGDYKKRGFIPGTSKATTDWMRFAGSKAFPLLDQMTNSGDRPSFSAAARLAGVNVYKEKKKNR